MNTGGYDLFGRLMTHDEMIDVLKGLVFGSFDRTTAKEREALNMAIKELEQEPKTGHWIPHVNGIWIEYYKCSKCGKVHDTQSDYCEKCGIRMESE